MKTVAIVQARIGSTRLPGKMLMKIVGKSLLCRVIERIQFSKSIDEIILATTSLKEDLPLVSLAQSLKVRTFQGNAEDVLDRYYHAAKEVAAEVVVRITADCPLIDPVLLDKMVALYRRYSHSCDWIGLAGTCMEGIGGEIIAFTALQKAWQEARLASEREHVTPYIWKNPNIFKLMWLNCDPAQKQYANKQFSVDEADDLKLIRKIFKHLYQEGKVFLTKDVIALLRKKPELLKINEGKVINEGYLKSVKNERASLKFSMLTHRLCLGTVQLGAPYGIANQTGKPSYDEAKQILQYAFQNGIQFYDTAQDYGEREALLGKIFSELGAKEHLKIITKVIPDTSKEAYGVLKDQIKDSLKKLRQSCVWGVLLHRTQGVAEWKSLPTAVEKLKGDRLLAHFGVSVYEPQDALSFLQQDYVDVIQVPFNAVDRRLLDTGFFESARKFNKKIFIRSIYLQGLLTLSQEELTKKGLHWAKPMVQKVNEFVKKKELNLKHFLLQAILHKVPDAVIILGVDNLGHLRKNISLLEASPIKETILKEWWEHLPSYPEKYLNPSMWEVKASC